MFPAISTACLYPLETEKSLDLMLGMGFRDFEIFINSDSELSGPFLEKMRSRLNAFGARVYSLHLHTSGFESMLFFSEYKRRFEDSLSLYSRYFSGAKKLGAQLVVFHGDRKEGNLPAGEYYERFACLSRAAGQEEMVLAQENVSRCRSGSPVFVKNMREFLGNDNVKFVLDLKQARRSQVSPYEMMEAMGTDIANVHISDSDSTHDCLLPGHGIVDFAAIFRTLERNGYQGPAVIEVYRNNFGKAQELKEASKFIGAMLT